MWVAVGVVAAGAIGAAASTYASNKSASATKGAANTQAAATNRALDLDRDKYEYGKTLQEPFYKSSLPAYFNYVDAITGERQDYADPNYTKLSEDDIRSENYRDLQTRRNSGDRFFGKYSDNDLAKALDRNPTLLAYDPTKTYYRDPNGGISTNAPPILQSKEFNPTETPAFRWQQSQMEKNTGRTLRSLGRANSTFGMNVMGDQNRNLAASEYDRQLGRLADLTNIARGGASSLAGAASGYADSSGQKIMNNGNNQANASLAGAAIKQQGLYNSIQSGASLANLGLQAYNSMPKNTVDNYNPNTTYAGTSPGPWAG